MNTQHTTLISMPQAIARESTVLSSWAVMIYRLLTYRGMDAKTIFSEAGVDLNLLCNPQSRIPHYQINKIWQQAAKNTDDTSFSLDAGHVIYPGMYHSLSLAMSATPNILTLLKYMVRYRRIFHPLSRMHLSEANNGYRFTWGPLEPYVSPLGSDAVIASMIGLCRELISVDFSPVKVFIKRDLSNQDLMRYEDFFKAPVISNKNENVLLFSPRTVQKLLVTANPDMEQLCIKITQKYITTLDDTEIVNTVYCKIMEALPSQAHSEEAIAKDLHISLRTMQRRLHQAGTSYGVLLQETRKELALNYIKNTALSIQEISSLIGFSEPTNFSRAFKRWTGCTPISYKKNM